MNATATAASGPSYRFRVRCPDCGWSQTHRTRAPVTHRQRLGCPHCNRGVGVSKVRAAVDGGDRGGDSGPTCHECGRAAVYEREHEQGCVTYTRFYCTTHGRNLCDDSHLLDGQDSGNEQPVMADGGQEQWDVTEPAGLDEFVPLDMANNITDERVRERIAWIDGLGRAYADALDTSGGSVTRDGWFDCACGAEYRNAEAALDCCADLFESVDRGRGVETDGGQDREIIENQASGVSITAKLKRGTGTRDQDEIKVKAKGSTADEARENMRDVLPAVESWAEELRGIQPDKETDGGAQ
ncbi:MAG: hypothetical protein ABEI77_07510 [Halorientalis sp.]